MTRTPAWLVVAAGLLAAGPAAADGWSAGGGSIKEGGAVAVPVPVPVPVPDFAARWYLRADVSLGFTSPDISESGLRYGTLYGLPGDTSMPFGTPGSWGDSDLDTTFTWGGGFGYYWSPRFRTDLTIEGRLQRDFKMRGTYQYAEEAYAGGWSPTGNQVDGETTDSVKLTSGLFMFNAYYDLFRGGPFTPYIGAGVGFAVNQLQRRFVNYHYVCDPTTLFPGQDCSDVSMPSELRANETNYNVSFAAAAMAGFSYSLTPVTMLDFSYRFLYIGGSDVDVIVNTTPSRLSVGDTHEHQIRAGLRWNIQ
jgi:opacity protein-like surface antigen